MLLDGDGSWNLILPEGFVRKLSGKLTEIFQVACGLFKTKYFKKKLGALPVGVTDVLI